MGRELRRLLIDPGRLQGLEADVPWLLRPEESHYLTRVLRYGPGDRFAVVDGAGSLWHAELLDRGRASLCQGAGAPLLGEGRPAPLLVLAAAVVKRDFEVLLRMAVELGVDQLRPWWGELGAVQGGARPGRWGTHLREAAEQCERLWLPELVPDQTVLEGLGMVPGVRFWATTRRPQLPSLAQALEALPQGIGAPAAVALACGPEGGWSAAEEARAEALGWQPVQLGPRILRSSTAAVAGLTLLASWRHDRYGC